VAAMIAGVWLLSIVVSLPPLAGWKRPQPSSTDGFPLCVLSEEPRDVVCSTVASFLFATQHHATFDRVNSVSVTSVLVTSHLATDALCLLSLSSAPLSRPTNP